MLIYSSGLDLIALLAFGVGTALLGLTLLVGRSSASRRRRLFLALALCLAAGLATWLPPLEAMASARWPLLALAGACAACLLLATPYPRWLLAAFVELLGRPRVQGAALLASGLLLVVGLPPLVQQEAATLLRASPTYADNPVGTDVHQKPVAAWTDRGAPITVFDLGGHVALADEKAAEASLADARNLGLHLIRTAAPDGGSNCHGWVFTGGRYLVDGGDVERILHDNGYELVTSPRVGDLVIYRIAGTGPAHSAVVRVVADGGLVLLESKWNTLGVYLHEPDAYVPGSTWTYYRSPRAGHLLHGLDPSEHTPGAMLSHRL